jgi:hypothetical protein
MAVRNPPAAQALRDAVLAQAPEAKLDVMELDLSSMASVRAFASEFIVRGLPLNILMYVFAFPSRSLPASSQPLVLIFSSKKHQQSTSLN